MNFIKQSFEKFTITFIALKICLYLFMCVCVSVCHMCTGGGGGQKKVLDSLSCDLPDVGVGSQTQVLWVSRKYS